MNSPASHWRNGPLRLAVRLLLSVMMVGTVANNVVHADDTARGVEFFEKKIRPLLVKHCYECHGPAEASAKLRLDSRAGWEKGGQGGPAIVPGDPSASLLIRAVSHRDPQLKMPPKEAGGKLSDAQIDDLTTWIRQGAHDPRTGTKIVTDIEAASQRHWAFQPIVPPALDANAHPIDFLIERKLRENHLVATEPADMRTLVRRTTFDLIGLPPTEKQLATAREAYPRLIQELLASPRYGERWGRHWLDVARYSDAKDGVLMYGDARIRPFAYTYRDYVIRAFNDDKPFDHFVREQLAADRLKLPEGSPDLAALGLLTLGRMFDSNRHDVIDDQIDVVARGFLGLTISCARCHDHKFDPIPTADYYSLYGVFASCIEPLERPRIATATEAGKAFEQEFATKLKEVYDQQQTHYDSTLKTARERTPDYLVQVATTEPDVSETTIFFLSLIPDQLRPQITKRWRQLIARRAFADDPLFGPWHDLMREPVLKPEEWKARGIDQRIIDGLVAAKPQTSTEVAQAYGTIIRDVWAKNPDEADSIAALLISRTGPVWFPKRDVTVYLSRQPGDAFRGLLGQLDAIAVKHKDAAARAMVVADSEVLCDPVIFQRGDPSARGLPVPRRFLSALSKADRANFADGGGRLDLANAIASRDNPLTARVWVNRVWMHHFGEPLVENPSDFGLRTKRPVQYELLDFLADFFIRNGWRTKPLHELIVTSRAYQRASRIPETPQMAKQLEADAANSLLWRANRRRLDFEQMRDTLLVASGELDETMFGRPPLITDESNLRRTVYAFVERQNIPAMVQNFDFANADSSTPRRVLTTVPQQALFAMNSTFILGRAKALASRPAKTKTTNAIADLYLAAYGREPTAEELAWCNEFRQAGSLEQLAQVLLMSNELMFID
ncbi:MAG: DUF1553 domain-containing protein [Planctomycetes bacterium]|nr:DUF1553 domain-containing protein [Planctomycetota bacterium]